MTRKPHSNRGRITRRTVTAGLGAERRRWCGPVQYRARARRGTESRRAAAAVRLPGRHRPGLPARRRYRRRILKDLGLPALADHERRYRNQCRGRALTRREADRRGRAASGWRLRFRPEHRRSPRSPSRRAFPSSSTLPPPRRSPSRATSSCSATSRPRHDPARRLRQSEGSVRGNRRGAEVGGVHARQRHLRHCDEGRHRRGDAEVRHAVQDCRDHRL